jgi:6-phosphogluconolactonase
MKPIQIRLLSLSVLVLTSSVLNAEKYELLTGTYTNTGKSKGIYLFDIDTDIKTISQKAIYDGLSNPSFLALSKDQSKIYTFSENYNSGTVAALSINEKHDSIKLINKVSTKIKGPCHIATDDKNAFTSVYNGGFLSVFGINSDYSLTETKQTLGFTPSGNDKTVSHIHQVVIAPDQKHIITNDLGTDKVWIYKYNPVSKSEVLYDGKSFDVKAGSGPRHAVFSKNGKFFFLAHELDGTVSSFSYKNGNIKLIQENTVIRDNNPKPWVADIHLSPDNKYLYVTNRAPANDITCFKVSKKGILTFVSQTKTEGDGPRNFAITPDGKFIFIGHQFTDNITIFKRDAETGKIINTGMQINVGSPVCLIFMDKK